MGLGLASGSWDEALLSTALGAVSFWLLGAAVGLCVSAHHLLLVLIGWIERRVPCPDAVTV